MKSLHHKRRNKEIYKSGIIQLMSLHVSRAVRKAAKLKLDGMTKYVCEKTYAWRDKMDGDDPAHGRKSDFLHVLVHTFSERDLDKFILLGSTGYPSVI